MNRRAGLPAALVCIAAVATETIALLKKCTTSKRTRRKPTTSRETRHTGPIVTEMQQALREVIGE